MKTETGLCMSKKCAKGRYYKRTHMGVIKSIRSFSAFICPDCKSPLIERKKNKEND